MEDLQSLLEKINRDGVEKAEAEAAKIVSAAKAKAEALVKDAEAAAAKAKADAEQAASDYASRAAETVKQGARDTILKIEAAVTTMLEQLLVKDVEKALADEATVKTLVAEAVKGVTGAAAIRIHYSGAGMPEEEVWFTCNRPFLCVVLNRRYNVPLFAAVVNDP